MRGTLYGKLAAALLVLLVFAGVSYVAVTVLASRSLVHEVNQTLNRDVAAHLVDELHLMEGERVNEEALKQAFHMMMVVNPSLEIYLLDPEGRILAYSADPGKVRRDRVALEPIARFLGGPGGMPVLGDDPRDPGGSKAFSAAPVGDPARPDGYLYVVLGGQLYDSALQMFQGSTILRSGSMAVMASLLVTLAAGLLIFRIITRRVRSLTRAVESFASGGFREAPAQPGPARRAGDEIDRLDSSFRQMARRMVEMLDELRSADAARRELVANVSHDLRTPLASLQGYLETLLLKEGGLDQEQRRRYLETAMGHSQRLGRLVGTLFELAKLESPSTRLEPEPFSLAELVQDIAQKMQLSAEKAGVRLVQETEADLPFVQGDIALMERALENLVENAIRHTPGGGEVAVSLKKKDRAILVEVRDTGQGIPEEALPRIFDRFYRFPRDGREAGEGAGLGLAITRRILELHGSRIRASNLPGSGACFSFQVPTGARAA